MDSERLWLKEQRIKLGYSQKDIAKELGITQQYYSSIEKCNRQQQLTLPMAVGLCRILDFNLDEIISNENI